MQAVEFDVQTPTTDAVLREQVIHALSLGLVEAAPRPHPRSMPHLKVIAGGPTARLAKLDGATLAVNNALKLFTDQGKAPVYWAGCDPQAHLADFLRDAPTNTIYLVASKCHPSVFEALKNRKVIVWHVDDPCVWDLIEHRNPVATSVSITLTSFGLMEMLGYRTFETWGWDGCYIDGQDHASPQVHGGSDIRVGVPDESEPDGYRYFDTTNSWALEAQDALNKLPAHNVSIMGDGFIAARAAYHFRQREAA